MAVDNQREEHTMESTDTTPENEERIRAREAERRLKDCEGEKNDFVTSLKMSAEQHARTRDAAAKLTDEVEAIAWDLSAGMNWREVRDRLLAAVTTSGLARP